MTQCLSGGQSTVGPEERVIFLTDRSDFAQLLKDEGCMTHSMTHAADPLAQLEGRERIGGGRGGHKVQALSATVLSF